MKGKTFEKEVSTSLKEIWNTEPYFFFRRLLDNARIGITVPADFFALHAGRFFLFECKSSKNKVSFPFANVKEHQIEDMLEAMEAGAYCYLLIKHSCREPEVFAMPIHSWITIMESSDRKSITWDDLRVKALCLNKTSAGNWDLWSLFKV